MMDEKKKWSLENGEVSKKKDAVVTMMPKCEDTDTLVNCGNSDSEQLLRQGTSEVIGHNCEGNKGDVSTTNSSNSSEDSDSSGTICVKDEDDTEEIEEKTDKEIVEPCAKETEGPKEKEGEEEGEEEGPTFGLTSDSELQKIREQQIRNWLEHEENEFSVNDCLPEGFLEAEKKTNKSKPTRRVRFLTDQEGNLIITVYLTNPDGRSTKDFMDKETDGGVVEDFDHGNPASIVEIDLRVVKEENGMMNVHATSNEDNVEIEGEFGDKSSNLMMMNLAAELKEKLNGMHETDANGVKIEEVVEDATPDEVFEEPQEEDEKSNSSDADVSAVIQSLDDLINGESDASSSDQDVINLEPVDDKELNPATESTGQVSPTWKGLNKTEAMEISTEPEDVDELLSKEVVLKEDDLNATGTDYPDANEWNVPAVEARSEGKDENNNDISFSVPSSDHVTTDETDKSMPCYVYKPEVKVETGISYKVNSSPEVNMERVSAMPQIIEEQPKMKTEKVMKESLRKTQSANIKHVGQGSGRNECCDSNKLKLKKVLSQGPCNGAPNEDSENDEMLSLRIEEEHLSSVALSIQRWESLSKKKGGARLPIQPAVYTYKGNLASKNAKNKSLDSFDNSKSVIIDTSSDEENRSNESSITPSSIKNKLDGWNLWKKESSGTRLLNKAKFIKKGETIDDEPIYAQPNVTTGSVSPLSPSRILKSLPKPNSRGDIVNWFKEGELHRSGIILSLGNQPGYNDGNHSSVIVSWFFGLITRAQAENFLVDQPTGTFLVRISTRIWGYTLSYKGGQKVKHFIISAINPAVPATMKGRKEPEHQTYQQQLLSPFLPQGCYSFIGTNTTPYNTLASLIRHHSHAPITKAGGERLLQPCPGGPNVTGIEHIFK